MWWSLENKQIPCKHMEVIKYMCDGAVTSVRTIGGDTSSFPTYYSFSSSLIVRPYVFVLVMDELERHV